MPVMNPSMSLLNLTPSSYGLASAALGLVGTVVGFHKPVHGQAPTTTETVMPAPDASRLPLSSIERLRIVAAPGTLGDQSKLQVVVPAATCHVLPPSTDTSTLATAPPPVSAAVPLMVTRLPVSIAALAAGDVMVDVGAKMSVVAPAAIRGRAGSAPGCREPGCTPMSASRFTVACWIA